MSTYLLLRLLHAAEGSKLTLFKVSHKVQGFYVCVESLEILESLSFPVLLSCMLKSVTFCTFVQQEVVEMKNAAAIIMYYMLAHSLLF